MAVIDQGLGSGLQTTWPQELSLGSSAMLFYHQPLPWGKVGAADTIWNWWFWTVPPPVPGVTPIPLGGPPRIQWHWR